MSREKELVVRAIEHGTVIDHIPSDRTLLVVEMLTGPEDCTFIGVNLGSSRSESKGIIKISDKELSESEMMILGALAPHSTVNTVKDYKIVRKEIVEAPEEVVSVFECPNQRCVSRHESVSSRFYFKGDKKGYGCHYCERTFPVARMGFYRTRRTEKEIE